MEQKKKKKEEMDDINERRMNEWNEKRIMERRRGMDGIKKNNGKMKNGWNKNGGNKKE